MFILGIITLVLEITAGFVDMQSTLYPTDVEGWSISDTAEIEGWSITRMGIVIVNFSRLMVRLHDAPISSVPLN